MAPRYVWLPLLHGLCSLYIGKDKDILHTQLRSFYIHGTIIVLKGDLIVECTAINRKYREKLFTVLLGIPLLRLPLPYPINSVILMSSKLHHYRVVTKSGGAFLMQ